MFLPLLSTKSVRY